MGRYSRRKSRKPSKLSRSRSGSKSKRRHSSPKKVKEKEEDLNQKKIKI